MPERSCPGCGTGYPASHLSCPACQRLTYKEKLEVLAAEAEACRARGALKDERAAWREALGLLPEKSRQADRISGRIDAVNQGLEAAPDEQTDTGRGQPNPSSYLGKAGAGLGVLALSAWKFKAVLAFLLTKGKLLLAGLTKSGTIVSMFLSLGVYWVAFGWYFALGLIVLLYVHETGHIAALRHYGISASAPMFIPGVGAFIRLKQYPASPREDARVGLAGPLWGLAAAATAYAIYLASGRQPVWAAIAKLGAWINLFNLLPAWQLDGGRGFRALSRLQRMAATAMIAVVWLVTGEGLLVLLLVVAALTIWRSAPEKGDGLALAHYGLLLVALSALSTIPVPTA